MVLLEDGRPRLSTSGNSRAVLAETLEWGYRLAETPCQVDKNTPGGLWAAKGFKEFVEHMPAEKQATAAIYLENCRHAFGDEMSESTRTTNLGSFEKWIFPVISNLEENDCMDQLVSVQPMPGPTSQIVFMDIVTSKRKGNVPAGTQVWRALGGAVDRFSDSDEMVTSELVGTTNGGGAISGTLEYLPVRAGTVKFTIGAGVAIDDGNGNIVAGDFSGTINYANGAVSISGASGGTDCTCTYVYDTESNLNIMGYDMKLTSQPITAKPVKLKTEWSEEAAQNLQAFYNIKAENVLLSAITGALQYQKHRSMIMLLRSRAQAGVVTWDATPPTGTSYQAHKFSILDAFETASNFIFNATNTMRGNRLVCGLQACTVIATLPSFVPKGNQTEMQGMTYIGDLGNFKVFADPHYPVDEVLVLARADQWFRVAAVYAEYQKLYTTPDIMLPNFQHQRGFASSYAMKVINPKAIATIRLLNSPTSFGPTIG